MLTIDVRGLPRTMTETTLQALFEPHGRIYGMRLAKDLFSGECKGFAELKMEGPGARSAIAALNGRIESGATLRVGLHNERAKRGRR
jgi:RNA recognition motif-containing protein